MRPYVYIQTITKGRVLIASSLAWAVTIIVHMALLIDKEVDRYITHAVIVSLITIIVICNVIVYREVHRHEKEITAQQVDVASRENFLSQKRAFKLTVMIIILIITSYFPVISFVELKEPLKNVVSVGTLTSIFMVVGSLAAFNSLVIRLFIV